MIAATELQRIAQARLDDAKALLFAGRYDGATYLCGYAIELALKFRVCQILNWPEFPSTRGDFQDYRSFQTHDLDVLLHLSGQEARIKRDHFTEWSIVAEWDPEVRYSVVGRVLQVSSELMVRAADGLLKVL